MKAFAIALLALIPTVGVACDRPVCLTADPLRLSDIVTFDDQPSGFGPGRRIDGVLALAGASFGEMFEGQSLGADGDFDLVTGPGIAPLTLLPGGEGRNLSILRLAGTNVLLGDGPAGFPRVNATGEGAVAVLFARDQAAVRFTLHGGEGGRALVMFMGRDGQVLDSHTLGPLAENVFAFVRRDGREDIAGIVLSNRDPEGIALDELAFGSAFQVGVWVGDMVQTDG